MLLPMQKYYPRFSHVFSPVEWILWGVPTNAELAVEMLTRQENEKRRSLEEVESSIGGAVEPFTHGEEEVHDSASFMSGLSPASKIKYEYQKRTRKRSDSSGSGSILEMDNMSLHDKNGRLSLMNLVAQMLSFGYSSRTNNRHSYPLRL